MTIITEDKITQLVNTYDEILDVFVKNSMELGSIFQQQAQKNRKLLDNIALTLRKQRNLRIADFDDLTQKLIDERYRRFKELQSFIQEIIELHLQLKNKLKKGLNTNGLKQAMPGLKQTLLRIEEASEWYKHCQQQYSKSEATLCSKLEHLSQTDKVTYKKLDQLIDTYINEELMLFEERYQILTA